jgi:hypothetical protein
VTTNNQSAEIKRLKLDFEPLKDLTIGKALKSHNYLSKSSIIFYIVLALCVLIFRAGGVIWALFLAMFALTTVYNRHVSRIIYKFASANGWTVSKISEYQMVPPTIRDLGHSQRLGPVVGGSFEGHNFQLFTYNYTVGSGKHSHTYFFTIFRVIQNVDTFPWILLDSQKNSGGAVSKQADSEKIRLEGNFNDYFSMHIKKSSHIDALSIITPDVMQTMISSNTKQDIEIMANSIWFITRDSSLSYKSIPGLFLSVDKFADEIAHKAKSYRPSGRKQPITTR